jgi:hypothetical protein
MIVNFNFLLFIDRPASMAAAFQGALFLLVLVCAGTALCEDKVWCII